MEEGDDVIVMDGEDEGDDGDLISPQGQVQTRTRSARKKRKLVPRQKQQRQQPQQLDYEEEEEEEEDKEEEPLQKKARQSSSSTAARLMGEEDEEDRSSNTDSAAGGGSSRSSQNEEGMSGTEDSKIPAATAKAASAVTAAASAVEATTTQQQQQHGPPLMVEQRLRIPSQQTPGKKSSVPTANTAAAANARMVAGDRRRLSNHPNTTTQQQDQVPVPSRGLDYGFSGSSGGRPPLVAAASQQQPSQQHQQHVRPPLGMAASPPTSPVAAAPAPPLKLPPRQVVVVIPNETAREIQSENLQIVVNLRQDLAQWRDDLAYDLTRYQRERNSLLHELLPQHLKRVKELSARWNQAKEEARSYPLLLKNKSAEAEASREGDEDELLTPEAVANLDTSTLQELLGEGAILDVSFLASWKLPPSRLEACGANSSSNKTNTIIPGDNASGSVVVDPSIIAAAHETILKEAQVGVRDLLQAAAASATEIMSNKTIEYHYRGWMADYLVDQGSVPEYERLVRLNQDMSNMTFTIHKPPPTKKKKPNIALGATHEAIAKTIAARMEMERADQTGRIDYASVVNGAAVIRVGERRTSPSLVDRLPVGNRIADLLSLRHYGYGPEAALTPTHPPLQLGHCWAFEKDEGNKLSAYATLSFKLAKMIEVQSVSVEHPTHDISDRTISAIRNFRVMGFEDPYASGKKPWLLGAFQYKLGGEIRQEFQVRVDFHGEKLPPLQSISVLIDENWGDSYACLYRFRVFGKEVAYE